MERICKTSSWQSYPSTDVLLNEVPILKHLSMEGATTGTFLVSNVSCGKAKMVGRAAVLYASHRVSNFQRRIATRSRTYFREP